MKSQLHTSNFVYNFLTVLFFFRGFFSTTLDLIHRSSFLLWSLRHTYINNTQGYHREQSGQDVPVNILTQLKFWFIYTVKQPRKGSFFTWTCDLLLKPQPFRHPKPMAQIQHPKPSRTSVSGGASSIQVW